MLGDDRCAAVETAPVNWTQREDRRLAGDLGPIAEDVRVDEDIAADHDPLAPERPDDRVDAGGIQLMTVNELANLGLEGIGAGLHRRDEGRRREDHVARGEDHAPAVSLDDLPLKQKPRVAVAFVLLALHIDVGLDALK